jgi:hypothetical protein
MKVGPCVDARQTRRRKSAPTGQNRVPFSDGDDHLSAHDLPFQVGVGIVFARAVVVVVVRIGIERGKLFEPFAEIVVKPTFRRR